MNLKRLIFGTLVIIIGLSMLFDVNFLRFFIPVLIIYFGLKIMLGDESSSNEVNNAPETNEDKISRVLIFSSMSNKYLSKSFMGGSVVAVFGGGDVDLREVETKEKEIKLDLVAIFGGIKIRVPDSWQINSEGVGILGAFNNNSTTKGTATTNLKIDGVAVFGAVDVTN